MAKINSSTITITVSKLVANNAPDVEPLTPEVKGQLVDIVKELAGEGSLVEVEEK